MPHPQEIRIVVVTMFESALEESERFGEFRLWVEGVPLAERISFPYGWRELRGNSGLGALGIVTGVGTARSAASIMALGMDPRFDLRRAYWLVAGIAGANPLEASVGSAAWAEWVVDTDLAFEIDAREIPADWPTGYLPLGRSRPYELPADPESDGWVHRLDPGLADWAWRLTAGLKLDDPPALQAARTGWASFPAAEAPPRVMRGDVLSGSTFWHGALFNQRAIDWMQYWTEGSGRFVMTAMEDSGTLQALSFLARAGRADLHRVLLLRTASNYTMPPPGADAAASLTALPLSHFPGYRPALDAAYRVGRVVFDEITRNWPAYADTPPGD